MKFEPPPSPIRRARTAPVPRPRSSRNARTRSRIRSGGFVRPSASAEVSTTSIVRSYAAHESPSPVPHAPRGGVVLPRGRVSRESDGGAAERGRGRTGTRRRRGVPRHRPRPRRHERAPADARDRRHRRARSRARVVARAAGDPGRPPLGDPRGRPRARVRARVPRRDPERREVPPRGVDRRALRSGDSGSRAARRRPSAGTQRSPSATAASTGPSSRTR